MQHTPQRYSMMSRPRPGGAFTILVIDDDPGLLETATELLSADGHRVLVASRGLDALAMMQAVHPDLILLDYYMPDMDGLAVIEQLKADAATRRIPVVAGNLGDRGGCKQAQARRIHRRHSQAVRADGLSAYDRRRPQYDRWSTP